MLDKTKLNEAIACYKKELTEGDRWEKEKYKWEAIKCFQDNWDLNAPDFAEMLKASLAKTHNLLTSLNYYPKKMLEIYTEAAPEEVKASFIALFDETQDVVERILAFKESLSKIHEKRGKEGQHYQTENTISAYLWFRYPDKYCLYKFTEVKNTAEKLGSELQFKGGAYRNNLKNFYALCNEIKANFNQDEELRGILESRITEECYSDPELMTLTQDFVIYVGKIWEPGEPGDDIEDEQSNEGEKEKKTPPGDKTGNGEKVPEQYWWLNANPKIWSFSNIAVGEEQAYTLYNENGNKRRIFQNFLDAKVGDLVIAYESNPVKQVVAIARVSAEQDGEKIYFEKLEGLYSPIDYSVLKTYPELEKVEHFVNPNGTLFKLTKSEYDFILDVIRKKNPVEKYSKENFLEEVFMSEEKYDRIVSVLKKKKNIILQGAPGVGKTFAAKRLAYSVMGEKDESRIELIQFHQNYSYEDFMMGYKPEGESFELKYGVFYRFCQRAANNPEKDYFFIIDEINRGNMSKIFGELLMLIENDYRGTKTTLAYNGQSFSVPKNLHIIGMMNTADRSLAMIDYALRRRFSFFDMEPGFDSEGFLKYQEELDDASFNALISKVKELNKDITADNSLGKGFCIGHSYFCGIEDCTAELLLEIIECDIIPMLSEYWFDDSGKLLHWENALRGIFQ